MKNTEFHVGDIVSLGTLEDRKIEWKILAIDGAGALITSCCGVSLQAYNDSKYPCTWKTCSLRQWLNNDFLLSCFSSGERDKIQPVILADEDAEMAFTESQELDRAFILSELETERYFSSPSDRALLYSGNLSGTWCFSNGLMTTCRWWMRGKTETLHGRILAPVCDHDGSFGGYQAADSQRMAVRPAMWVDMSVLRPAELPDIDQMNIRLKKGDLGTITSFSAGYEEQLTILARFVDYETQEEYVIYNGPFSMFNPSIAKIETDTRVGETIHNKAVILHQLLTRFPYDEAADRLQKKLDQNRVRAWMNQMAWAPSAEECLQIKEGDIIHFGKMSPGKGKKKRTIPWLVLRRSKGKALLIAEKGIKSSTFLDDGKEEWEWEHSMIREWLNRDFYTKCFSPEEKRMIQKCVTECGDALGRISSRSLVYDNVFLLNDAEVSVFFSSDAARKISGTPCEIPLLTNGGEKQEDDIAGDWWWLRSPGDRHEYACCVDPDGCVDRHGCWVHADVCAIRPAILIDLSCNDIDYLADELAYSSVFRLEDGPGMDRPAPEIDEEDIPF